MEQCGFTFAREGKGEKSLAQLQQQRTILYDALCHFPVTSVSQPATRFSVPAQRRCALFGHSRAHNRTPILEWCVVRCGSMNGYPTTRVLERLHCMLKIWYPLWVL